MSSSPPSIPLVPELPHYSMNDQQVEHIYTLLKNGHRLSVKVCSKAASAEHIPIMHQAQTIRGSVELELQGEALIRAVTLTVIGEIALPSAISRFLNIRREIYTIESNESTSPTTANVHAQSNRKLKGTNTWVFSIKLPKGVSIPFGEADGRLSKFDLPASFDDTQHQASIKYQILVHVKKGTLMSTGEKLSVPFEYLPLICPDRPSVLRQIAYMEHTPFVGPEEDPDGWKIFDAIPVEGTVFNRRSIKPTYSISLGLPTCYTRGTPIHIFVTITSSDSQALDLLSSPSAQDIRLVCFLSYHDTAYTRGLGSGNGRRPTVEEATNIASAKFWPVSAGGEKLLGSRTLQGELIIPPDVPPGCSILNFTREYAIVMYPFKAAGFTPSISSKEALLTEKVEIATVPAVGPPAIPRSPPDYTLNET